MAGPRLEDLSQEILLEIVKSIHSAKDWYNLCLVKPFRPAATELLYREANFYDHNPALLLRTVLEYPKLAVLIRILDFRSYGEFEKHPIPSDSGISGFTAAVRALNLPAEDEARWITHLQEIFSEERDHMRRLSQYRDSFSRAHSATRQRKTSLKRDAYLDAIHGLVLLHTPNVKQIWLDQSVTRSPFLPTNSSHTYSQWWAVAFPSPACSLPFINRPSYGKLNSVSISTGGLQLKELASLFKLEALQELKMFGLKESKASEDWAWDANTFFEEDMSNIKSLTLTGAHIHLDAFKLIIRCCKSLRIFSYGDHGFWVKGFNVDYAHIANSLQKHKGSLQELEVRLVKARTSVKDMLVKSTGLETLSLDFKGLYLDQDRPTITELVPPNLQLLRITEIRRKSMPGLLDPSGPLSPLLDEGGLPYLESLEFGIKNFHEEDLPGLESTQIMKGLRKRDVDVRFFEQDYDLDYMGWLKGMDLKLIPTFE
ncbi:hypothetical protein CC80DRAFT_299727 [Byssothecium circinans]|uniref:F-box domain-containing protein n=1 Tax=Byssothecium circinans TaxID=147558 RepID=A0A6A5T6T8_9PLEO|nr:hypothetical protein CC80DRAFT_299727 [Byssothecium circinans]